MSWVWIAIFDLTHLNKNTLCKNQIDPKNISWKTELVFGLEYKGLTYIYIHTIEGRESIIGGEN